MGGIPDGIARPLAYDCNRNPDQQAGQGPYGHDERLVRIDRFE
jgi:hypothetical protein